MWELGDIIVWGQFDEKPPFYVTIFRQDGELDYKIDPRANLTSEESAIVRGEVESITREVRRCFPSWMSMKHDWMTAIPQTEPTVVGKKKRSSSRKKRR